MWKTFEGLLAPQAFASVPSKSECGVAHARLGNAGRSDHPELLLVGQAGIWSSLELGPAEVEAALSLEGDEEPGRRVVMDLAAATGR